MDALLTKLAADQPLSGDLVIYTGTNIRMFEVWSLADNKNEAGALQAVF